MRRSGRCKGWLFLEWKFGALLIRLPRLEGPQLRRESFCGGNSGDEHWRGAFAMTARRQRTRRYVSCLVAGSNGELRIAARVTDPATQERIRKAMRRLSIAFGRSHGRQTKRS